MDWKTVKPHLETIPSSHKSPKSYLSCESNQYVSRRGSDPFQVTSQLISVGQAGQQSTKDIAAEQNGGVKVVKVGIDDIGRSYR
jgi:hypothetical protein